MEICGGIHQREVLLFLLLCPTVKVCFQNFTSEMIFFFLIVGFSNF